MEIFFSIVKSAEWHGVSIQDDRVYCTHQNVIEPLYYSRKQQGSIDCARPRCRYPHDKGRQTLMNASIMSSRYLERVPLRLLFPSISTDATARRGARGDPASRARERLLPR